MGGLAVRMQGQLSPRIVDVDRAITTKGGLLLPGDDEYELMHRQQLPTLPSATALHSFRLRNAPELQHQSFTSTSNWY
jgi:hypothetical protein